MIVVSKCLLGENCKYNGQNNFNQEVVEFLMDKQYIAVCPEQMGGLPTPRIACERQNERVINKHGEDKTREFYLGACLCLELIREKQVDFAIMKSKSPSCGVKEIYDGTFLKRLISRDGVFVEALLEKGIKVFTEKDFPKSV